jgi:hypothetical protein
MTLSKQERNHLRDVHVRRSAMSFHSDGREREVVEYCDGCLNEDWPCPVIRLLENLESLETVARPRWLNPDDSAVLGYPSRSFLEIFKRPSLTSQLLSPFRESGD